MLLRKRLFPLSNRKKNFGDIFVLIRKKNIFAYLKNNNKLRKGCIVRHQIDLQFQVRLDFDLFFIVICVTQKNELIF